MSESSHDTGRTNSPDRPIGIIKIGALAVGLQISGALFGVAILTTIGSLIAGTVLVMVVLEAVLSPGGVVKSVSGTDSMLPFVFGGILVLGLAGLLFGIEALSTVFSLVVLAVFGGIAAASLSGDGSPDR